MMNNNQNSDLVFLSSLIDERIYKIFWDASKYFKSKDLVLFFDDNLEIDPVSAFYRPKLISGTDVPDTLKIVLNKPAREVQAKI